MPNIESGNVLFMVILVGAAFTGFSLTTWQDVRGVLSQIIDDTFYYSVTAFHISRGLGSTFDGIHLTNGYHPLWLLVQIPLFLVFPRMTETSFRLILGVQVLLAIFSVLLIYNIIRRQSHNTVVAFAVASAWIALQRRDLITGLETPLYTVALLCVAYQIVVGVDTEHSIRDYVLLGTLCSVAALARLDGIFLGVAIGIPLFFRWLRSRDRTSFGRMMGFGVPITITMLTYFAVNIALFGLFMPISGYIKQLDRATKPGFTDPGLFDYVQLLFWPLSAPRAHLLKILGLYGYPLLLSGLWLWRRKPGVSTYYGKVKRWWPFGVFTWMLLIYYVVAYYDPQGSTAYWYYAPARIMGILTAALLIEVTYSFLVANFPSVKSHAWPTLLIILLGMLLAWRLQFSFLRIISAIGATGLFLIAWRFTVGRARQVLVAGLVTLLAVLLPLLTVARTMLEFRPTNATAYYDAAMWIRTNTPDQSTVAAYNAGTMGFFSGRRVINLDGYINERAFRDKVQRWGLLGYLVTNSVDYLVDCFPRDPQFEQLPPYMGHSLQLIWKAPTLYRSCELRAYRVEP